jgi:hypothetical protein
LRDTQGKFAPIVIRAMSFVGRGSAKHFYNGRTIHLFELTLPDAALLMNGRFCLVGNRDSSPDQKGHSSKTKRRPSKSSVNFGQLSASSSAL